MSSRQHPVSGRVQPTDIGGRMIVVTIESWKLKVSVRIRGTTLSRDKVSATMRTKLSGGDIAGFINKLSVLSDGGLRRANVIGLRHGDSMPWFMTDSSNRIIRAAHEAARRNQSQFHAQRVLGLDGHFEVLGPAPLMSQRFFGCKRSVGCRRLRFFRLRTLLVRILDDSSFTRSASLS